MVMLFTEVYRDPNTTSTTQFPIHRRITAALAYCRRRLAADRVPRSADRKEPLSEFQVSELVGSVCVGLADLITDAFAYTQLLSGDGVPNEAYYSAYGTILCFGVVTMVLSLAYRLHNARLVATQMRKLGMPDEKASFSVARQQAQQHEWELAQTHRTKVVLSLGLVSAATQGPSPLRVSCVFRPSSHGASVRRDFCTAAAAAGPTA